MITIRNTFEAAVKFSPTPPAFSDISNTWKQAKIWLEFGKVIYGQVEDQLHFEKENGGKVTASK